MPAGVAPGVYDLTVVGPDGSWGVLRAAVTVRLPPLSLCVADVHCADDDRCNGDERCVSGVCFAGIPPVLFPVSPSLAS